MSSCFQSAGIEIERGEGKDIPHMPQSSSQEVWSRPGSWSLLPLACTELCSRRPTVHGAGPRTDLAALLCLHLKVLSVMVFVETSKGLNQALNP
ncbi:Uncharacterized protein DAT39_014363 [Clarias magur]|uniref:Uncharacterized protein n=1 Tax=Clarias magur TaxID=1594786 RepID=A0A8J4UEK5_CLAMG|nr:Uncharacterized protein DAT39_014363 [Clarias magur]